MPRVLIAAVLVLCWPAAGCRSVEAGTDDAEGRSEAARLSRAIDQLREADNSRKGEWLRLLEAESCAKWCALKQVCESAYREHVAALEAITEARAHGTAVPAAPDLAPGLDRGALAVAKLEEAERRLHASREQSARCIESQGAMKLRLKL